MATTRQSFSSAHCQIWPRRQPNSFWLRHTVARPLAPGTSRPLGRHCSAIESSTPITSHHRPRRGTGQAQTSASSSSHEDRATKRMFYCTKIQSNSLTADKLPNLLCIGGLSVSSCTSDSLVILMPQLLVNIVIYAFDNEFCNSVISANGNGNENVKIRLNENEMERE